MAEGGTSAVIEDGGSDGLQICCLCFGGDEVEATRAEVSMSMALCLTVFGFGGSNS